MIGLETALGLSLTHLYHTGKISLRRLVELYTFNPAKIISQPLGTLQVGTAGDVTIFDPDREWVFDVNQSQSKSRNSPFHGTPLKGKVAATIVAGKIVYRAPELH
ncbi:MAG: amidohydrolase family protein [Terriglobia bacterium]